MALKNFASSASNMFDRARQTVAENILDVEKTTLDEDLQNKLFVAEKTKEWAEKIHGKTSELLQPNPALRAELYLQTAFDIKAPEKMTLTERLGCMFEEAAEDVETGGSDEYVNQLAKVGLAERKLGEAERRFTHLATTNYLTPLKENLAGDLSAVQNAKSIVNDKRLELDIAKGKVQRAKKEPEITETKMALEVKQEEFDKQVEYTRVIAAKSVEVHRKMHIKQLKEFVSLQKSYFEECNEVLAELEREL